MGAACGVPSNVKDPGAAVKAKADEPTPQIITQPTPVQETAPAPVVETPAAVVEEAPAAVVEETPAPVVEEAPPAVVEEAPVAVVEEAPAEVIEEAPAAVVEETPAEVPEETPAAVGEAPAVVEDVAEEAGGAVLDGAKAVPGVGAAVDLGAKAAGAATDAVGAVGGAIVDVAAKVGETAVDGIKMVPGGEAVCDATAAVAGAATDAAKTVAEKTGDAIECVPGGVIVTGAVGVAAGAACATAAVLTGAEGEATQSTCDGGADPNYPPHGLSATLANCPEWIRLGCGNSEYICAEREATFSREAALGALPDFSQHNNHMTETFLEDPALWDQLKDLKTSMGVSLGDIIKTGVDNKGHPFIKTVGIAAGDEESYVTFAPLLDKVITARHKGFSTTDVHQTDMDMNGLNSAQLDPSGKYVLTVRVRTGRSIRGFKLPPVCSFEERRQLEAIIVKGLNNLDGDLAGEYFPLTGSRSYAPKPNGMEESKQDELREAGNLFQEPDSTLLLSSGCGRHWPDARGIYHNNDKNAFVWVNEEDHMRIVSMQKGDDLQAVCKRFAKLCEAVQVTLKAEGADFMHHERLGYVLTCPSNLGTGLRAGVMIKIPLCSAQANFQDWLKERGLQARGIGGVDSAAVGGVYDISNSDRLGKSEVQLVNTLIDGVHALIAWESSLEGAAPAEAAPTEAAPAAEEAAPAEAAPETAAPAPEAGGDDSYPPTGLEANVKTLPEWIQLGCGDAEYICAERGATFPGDECPADLIDLSEHNNIMSEVVRAQPELYANLKDLKTSLGVGLAKCVKTGMDNKGHPHIKTVGLVGGDEESFTLFKDLFDPIISARHNGYAADAIHPTNLNLDDMDTTRLDETGKYVKTARVRTGRSVRGFRLPPACGFDERRELERIIVKGLARLEGDLAGEYFPLHGSRSHAEKPTGMSKEKEEELRNSGNLFQEPDSTLLLSSGCGRHWPDARGIFHNNDKNAFVWVNEEDHMRIVSMQVGDDIQSVFSRFVKVSQAVQEVLKEEGADFMHSEHLGYILSCPSNLGTGLRAGCLVAVPLLSARPDFKDIMGKMGLQARGGGGVDSDSVGGVYDISNADRLGKSEIDLVNIMIRGVRQIVEWEMALEAGEEITVP